MSDGEATDPTQGNEDPYTCILLGAMHAAPSHQEQNETPNPLVSPPVAQFFFWSVFSSHFFFFFIGGSAALYFSYSRFTSCGERERVCVVPSSCHHPLLVQRVTLLYTQQPSPVFLPFHPPIRSLIFLAEYIPYRACPSRIFC